MQLNPFTILARVNVLCNEFSMSTSMIEVVLVVHESLSSFLLSKEMEDKGDFLEFSIGYPFTPAWKSMKHSESVERSGLSVKDAPNPFLFNTFIIKNETFLGFKSVVLNVLLTFHLFFFFYDR